MLVVSLMGWGEKGRKEGGREGWFGVLARRWRRASRSPIERECVGMGGQHAYLLMWPSLISSVFICERRSGSSVAGV